MVIVGLGTVIAVKASSNESNKLEYEDKESIARIKTYGYES